MKVVLQDGIKDCGICCLLSIIRYYGGEVSKEYLRELTNTTKEGVSFYNLIEGAKKIGFEAVGLTGNIENIEVNNLPCIVHFIVNKSYKHFVVLYQINKKKHQVHLMDPAKGKKIISISEFNLLTSNNYIFLNPTKKLPIMKKKKVIFQKIKHIVKNYKKSLFLIILLTITSFLLNIGTSFHFKYLLDFSIQYQITNNIPFISYTLLSLYILKNINVLLKNILLNKWTSIFDYEITTTTYKQILLLPYLYFKNRTTGEVISRLKDINMIRSFLCNLFCIASTDIMSMGIFLWIMSRYQPQLTEIIIGISSLIGLILLISNKMKKKRLIQLKITEDRINSNMIQGISNVDTIKGSHLEKRMSDYFSLNYKQFLERIYEFTRFTEVITFIKNNLKDMITLSIYGLGSYYCIKEKLSLSSLIVYQSFFSYYLSSYYQSISLVEEYSMFKVSLDRIEEIFLVQKDNFKNNYYYLPYTLEGDIVYHDLEYKVGSKKIFNHLNLTIKKGDKILLSGASGSGKSTLLKMLLRYIEVDYGHITLSGIDINHYHLENIRSNITYVTSEEYLFTDTIRNNIVLYKDYSEEEFEKVCKICMIDEIIKNNMIGYDSIVEENGFNYSHGERQRIILARSIIKKSNIYILDESFSGIDIEKEKRILMQIFEYLEGKTILVISHRFNNKKLYNRILKLENGQIHES